jgi:manganese-dependent ADP-ribose/CDP-alcohol diphosphatase
MANDDLKAVFGLITDIQYADCVDGQSWDKKRTRYYRNSLNLVTNAVNYWKDYEIKNDLNLNFIIQLGDLIDTKAKQTELGSLNSMLKVIEKLNELRNSNEKSIDLLHIWGNHEFYNFKRSDLLKLPLNTAHYLNQNEETNANYYVYTVTDKITLICLDYYEFSVIGYENDTTNSFYLKCLDLLKKYNKNDNLNNELNLSLENQKYLAFNGGLDTKQFDWLANQLSICKSNDKKAIICGHVPINVNSSNPMNLAFNNEQITDLLFSYENTVCAYLCGHFHPGGYFKETRNNNIIHHITFSAVVETEPGKDAFSLVKCYSDKILIEQTNKQTIQIDLL